MLIKCPNCGYEGKSASYVKGSILIELFCVLIIIFSFIGLFVIGPLALFFIAIGFIYPIWRISTKYTGCPKCKYQYVVKQ